MTVPITGITPVYGIEYPVAGEPVRNTRAKLERSAKQIEAALTARGVTPPAAADWTALTARVSAVDADTGWQPLTPLNGTAALSGGMYYRKLGRVCYLQLQAALPASFAAGTTITVLPSGARPVVGGWYGAGQVFGGAVIGVQITAAGAVSLSTATTAGGVLYGTSFATT